MNFRQLRESRGLTQGEIELLTGVKSATVSQIELGKVRNPTYRTIAKLAGVLNVTPDVVARAIAETDAA